MDLTVLVGLILTALTLVSRARVTPAGQAEAAVEEVLAMAPPTPEETGEAAYLADLSADDSTQFIPRVT